METKQKVIVFRATNLEYKKLHLFAKKHKINVSEAIRTLMAQDFQYLGKHSEIKKSETILTTEDN